MSVKRNIIFDEWFEIFSVLHHVIDNIMSMFIMIPTMSF